MHHNADDMILGPSDLYEISRPGTIKGKQYFTENIPVTSVSHSSFPNVSKLVYYYRLAIISIPIVTML